MSHKIIFFWFSPPSPTCLKMWKLFWAQRWYKKRQWASFQPWSRTADWESAHWCLDWSNPVASLAAVSSSKQGTYPERHQGFLLHQKVRLRGCHVLYSQTNLGASPGSTRGFWRIMGKVLSFPCLSCLISEIAIKIMLIQGFFESNVNLWTP